VTEPVTGEIILHEFEKLYFLVKECILIFFGFTGEVEALVIRNTCIVFPVLVKSGELPPVYGTAVVWFTVEHIGINTTDSKTAVINPALSVFQKPAASINCILCPHRIPGNIENAVLVAEFGRRRRFKSSRVKCPDRGDIAVEQEYMTVECPGTALRT
jgi:hypothetical protein